MITIPAFNQDLLKIDLFDLFLHPDKMRIFGPNKFLVSLLLLLTLSWLTVSLPFVYAEQVQLSDCREQAPKEDKQNPLAGMVEEKNEAGINSLSEYLHDLNTTDHHPELKTISYKNTSTELYLDHHPELISPPPKVSLA